MDDAILVLCTAPATGDAAVKLARGIVEGGLAACVNIVPGLRSFYTWKGAVNDDAEVQLLIKTRRGRYPDLEKHIRENHPYEVPEVIAIPIERGSEAYLSWLREQTS
jgi:periplasmic divalent cation tolerance protein